MWMNGNVTKDGITLDLEAMKRMGIGGFLNFNAAVGIPRGPVDYAGTAWTDAVCHAAAYVPTGASPVAPKSPCTLTRNLKYASAN